MSTELKAMDIATAYYQKRGYTVQNVSKSKQHGGYDLLVKKSEDPVGLKVEVKGSKDMYGIPDPYHTEFDKNKKLVADILCVVHIASDPPTLCIIKRDDIPPEFVVPRMGYRIAGGFQSEKYMEKFRVHLEPS